MAVLSESWKHLFQAQRQKVGPFSFGKTLSDPANTKLRHCPRFHTVGEHDPRRHSGPVCVVDNSCCETPQAEAWASLIPHLIIVSLFEDCAAAFDLPHA